MIKHLIGLLVILLIVACNNESSKKTDASEAKVSEIEIYEEPSFTVSEANKLIELPLHCLEVEYPNKLGQVIGSDADLQPPNVLHPIFYGCFDWHSAVHGYWSMVNLLKEFPEMDKAEAVRFVLKKNIRPDNVALELAYFQKKINKSYERTYGWAWLLKLA